MALKVELKPNERIIIGSCVITNVDQRARLLIEGENTPVLREKDILTPATANTPAKLIYLAVQLMYLSPDPKEHHLTYFTPAEGHADGRPELVVGDRRHQQLHSRRRPLQGAEGSEEADRAREGVAGRSQRSEQVRKSA